jgi:hypothetical protein
MVSLHESLGQEAPVITFVGIGQTLRVLCVCAGRHLCSVVSFDAVVNGRENTEDHRLLSRGFEKSGPIDHSGSAQFDGRRIDGFRIFPRA